jgi:hypothetical protein
MQSNQLAERGLPGRDFADTAESSLDSIPEDRSTSRHHDLARRHILLQQRRAMQEVIERVGNSSITDSSFSEKESSDYAAETNESSRNIFGHFNSSSSSLPQEFPTTTTQTNNLKQVLPKALSLRNLLASETRALSLRNLFASGTRALSLRKLFASETKESSSNCIFDHFNWSSSSFRQEPATTTFLPQETSTITTQTNNLRPMLLRALSVSNLFAAETEENSRNISDRFNCSSRFLPQETSTTTILPQETLTTTTQTNNLKPVLSRAFSLRNVFEAKTRALSLRNLFASETKESSSNCIFDHFNWSSSSLPYETSTRIIRAKNLRPVEAQDNKGSQRVTTKARAEKKSSRKSRSKSPERSIPKREHTKGMLGRMVWPRDLSERNVSPSEDDQSKATRRSNQRSNKSGKLPWGKKQQASNEE